MGEQLRSEMHAMGEQLRSEMHAMGAELRSEMRAMGEDLRSEMRAMGENLVQRIDEALRQAANTTYEQARREMGVVDEKFLGR